ncbi:MAG: wax ester/triacylglycerol synthase family O-acyltransferase [Nocardioides sp.]|jgi:diacylglycerol O-acyltransferase / wax synthase
MSRERMDHADAAWLRMDSPTNLMVVNSVLWFDGPVDEEALRAVLADRLVSRFRRFRQRVAEDHGTWWEDDPNFDLTRHIHSVALPAPGRRRELEAFVASYLTVPLDRSRPLWDLYVLDEHDGGTAMLFRMHHCIADGIALTRVLLSLTDDGESYAGVASDTAERSGPHGRLGGLARGALHEAIATVTHPGHLVDLAVTGFRGAQSLTKLLLLPPDGRFWERRTGLDKQVTWSEPIPLDRIKRACHASHATINDVLLAAVAGALRSDRERRGSAVHDMRALVPFNLRPLDQPLPSGLGNEFGLVYLDLPLATASPAGRLEEMSRRMQAIKHSADGAVSYGVLELVGQAPPVIEKAAVDVFAAKGSAVMTNVVGPREPVTLAGSRLRGTMGWVPMSGTIGLGVSIFSYAGDVVIGLSVDRLQVEDAHLLMEDILAELQVLVARGVSTA